MSEANSRNNYKKGRHSMDKLILSTLSLDQIKRCVNLQTKGIANYEWTQNDAITLMERELRRLQDVVSDLVNSPIHLMNEATLFARAIYPMLLLAEQPPIQAWAEVALQAQYAQFKLEGIVDGVLAKSSAGVLEFPYLVVVEAKRGVEGHNPVFQLYGQLLVAAHLNWETEGQLPQEIFGCYTIADIWTFVRAEIDKIDSELPTMTVEFSREYDQKYDAERILKILKRIVSKRTSE
jgi:hypothetical protein